MKDNRDQSDSASESKPVDKTQDVPDDDPIVLALNRVYGENPDISRLPKDIAYLQFRTLKRHGQ
ncbi:MAG: hypothetical protein NTW86_00710 [Candidatus Sumerlaeota bacterium]|nr:hypothetical protein [Candidatus Sumerlaeota bacterium]